jgi:hypothetical protein
VDGVLIVHPAVMRTRAAAALGSGSPGYQSASRFSRSRRPRRCFPDSRLSAHPSQAALHHWECRDLFRSRKVLIGIVIIGVLSLLSSGRLRCGALAGVMEEGQAVWMRSRPRDCREAETAARLGALARLSPIAGLEGERLRKARPQIDLVQQRRSIFRAIVPAPLSRWCYLPHALRRPLAVSFAPPRANKQKRCAQNARHLN